MIETGAELKAARENAGLNHETFARLVGKTRESVMRWERGEKFGLTARLACTYVLDNLPSKA